MNFRDPWALVHYVFCKIFCPCKHNHHPDRAKITVRYGSFAVSFEGDFMATLPDDKTVTASVAYVDAKNFPAKVDGAPVWTTDPPDALTVTVAPDGMSAELAVNTGAPGTTVQGTINADADLGAGVKSLITLFSVDIVAGEAVTGTVSFGDPT
jgi:hypothetical protein